MEKGNISYTIEEASLILLSSNKLPDTKNCKAQPSRVSCNASFLVDLSSLSDPSDITAVDLGTYQSHGAPRGYAYVIEENNTIHRMTTMSGKMLKED